MSPDPVVPQVGDSQRGNPYSYVSNRPLTLTDPTGAAQTSGKPKDGSVGGFGPILLRAMATHPALARSILGEWGTRGSGAPGGNGWGTISGNVNNPDDQYMVDTINTESSQEYTWTTGPDPYAIVPNVTGGSSETDPGPGAQPAKHCG
jgi:hypothetical protein